MTEAEYRRKIEDVIYELRHAANEAEKTFREHDTPYHQGRAAGIRVARAMLLSVVYDYKFDRATKPRRK